jgi:hypothetical protein
MYLQTKRPGVYWYPTELDARTAVEKVAMVTFWAMKRHLNSPRPSQQEVPWYPEARRLNCWHNSNQPHAFSSNSNELYNGAARSRDIVYEETASNGYNKDLHGPSYSKEVSCDPPKSIVFPAVIDEEMPPLKRLKQSVETNGVPATNRCWFLRPNEHECSFFEKNNYCAFFRYKCSGLHVQPPLGAIVDSDNKTDVGGPPTAVIYTHHELDDKGATWFTAALRIYESFVCLSEGQEGVIISSRVWYYRTEEAAIAAAQRVMMIASTKENDSPNLMYFYQSHPFYPTQLRLGIPQDGQEWIMTCVEKICWHYYDKGVCRYNHQCTRLHVRKRLGPKIDAPENDLDCQHLLSQHVEWKNLIRVTKRIDIYGRVWYTAAFRDDRTRRVYFAEGSGGFANAHGIWWYYMRQGAILAVAKVMYMHSEG